MQNQKSPPELPNSWRTAATQRRLSVDTLLSLLLVGVLQGGWAGWLGCAQVAGGSAGGALSFDLGRGGPPARSGQKP